MELILINLEGIGSGRQRADWLRLFPACNNVETDDPRGNIMNYVEIDIVT